MNYKRWNIAIVSFVLCVVLFITGMNYFVDPFGYFHFKGGDYENVDFQMNTEQYLRFFKSEHIKNFSDEYDAYIIGGSKTGSYRPEKLSEMDGYNYYNVWCSAGSVQNYYYYAKYILENTNAKKIIINLSGGEVRFFDRQNGSDVNVIPAEVTGKSVFMENLEFLFKDVHVAIEKYEKQKSGKVKKNYENPTTGERTLQKYYKARNKNYQKFTNKYVLKKFDQHMQRLFTTTVVQDAYQENLDALQEIKDLCDAKGVEFMLMLAPSFIGEMSEHDSPLYWDYMNKLVMITDYWDFSGYHDIDLNPYNYYNEGHFFFEIADLVVDTITGKDSYEGFGTYVTKENVYEHLQQRKADYERLQKEYQETGTIQLYGYDHKSNIVSDTEYQG